MEEATLPGLGLLIAQPLRRTGIEPSEVTDSLQQFFIGAIVDSRCPSNQIRPQSKQHEYPAITELTGLQATIDAPASSTSTLQGGRGCSQSVSSPSVLLSKLLAGRPGFRTSAQDFLGAGGLDFRNLTNVHRPHSAANGDDVLRVVDFLMAKELGPGSVGSVAVAMG